MTPTQASLMRGLLQWVDRGLTGRPCRGALVALTERQYFEDKSGHRLSPQLEQATVFLLSVLHIMPERNVNMGQELGSPLVLYSDASTTGADGRGLRIGILLLEKGHP